MFGGFHLSWMGTFYCKSSTWAKEAVVFLFRNGLTWACIGNNKLNPSKLIKDILLDNPLYLKVFSMLYLPRKDIGKYISFYKKKKRRKNLLKSFCLVACVFELFWKNSSYIIYRWFWVYQYLCGFVGLWLCGFVSLYVRMFVAEANKVEGTTSWCVRTNEILASDR